MARAQLRTEVSARQVEVGDSFQVQLTALSSNDGEDTEDPELIVPPAISVRGPSISSRTQVSISNGRMTRSVGITATWTLTAQRPGRYKIGPPSIVIGGRRQRGNAVEVEVLPAGALPQRRDRRRPTFDPFDWFDPFGGAPFPRGVPDPTSDDFSGDLPPVPPEFALESAPDPNAFARVRVTPENPVVGQQVTLDIYAYASRSPVRIQNVSEPSRPDFLAFGIEDADDTAVRVPIGDDVFVAQRVRKYALFPLKAGKLSIGAVEVVFSGERFGSRRPLERSSAPLEIEVEEPPLAGRPAGYRLGDVGQYSLTATVEPRQVAAGEAVSVVARLEGTGNVPPEIAVPQQRGVEWLTPNVVSDVQPHGGTVRGFRSFTYVVKLTQPGKIDLGELSLPYWDPEAKAYKTARAILGEVEVARAERAKAAAPAPASPLDQLGKPRTALSPTAAPPPPLTDQPWFWILSLGAPLGVVLTDGGVRLARLVRRRSATRRNDPRALAERALEEARSGSDAAQEAAAVERALLLAIEAATGLRARGMLKDELGKELPRAGVGADDAQSTVALLEQCEVARFTAQPGRPEQRLVSRAEPLVRALLRRKPARGGAG